MLFLTCLQMCHAISLLFISNAVYAKLIIINMCEAAFLLAVNATNNVVPGIVNFSKYLELKFTRYKRKLMYSSYMQLNKLIQFSIFLMFKKRK